MIGRGDLNEWVGPNGVAYVAVDQKADQCEGCAFDWGEGEYKLASMCQAAPDCYPQFGERGRPDMRNVVWIVKG